MMIMDRRTSSIDSHPPSRAHSGSVTPSENGTLETTLTPELPNGIYDEDLHLPSDKRENSTHSVHKNGAGPLSNGKRNGTVIPGISQDISISGNENIWQKTPYTRRPTGSLSSTTEANIDSVYSIEFQKPGANSIRRKTSREGGNRVGIIPPSEINTDTEYNTDPGAFAPRHLPVYKPPIGHHGDFYGVMPRKHNKGLFSGWNGTDDNENGFYEEKMTLMDDSTVFGKAFSALGFKQSQSLSNKDTRKQARNALKLADSLTSVPLSKVWHVFTEVFNNLVFFMNIAVAIADIARGPEYLYYKVTALVLGLLENFIGFIMWAIKRHPKFKNTENKDKFEKYQQYIENVVSESLIYPLLILSILGFTTEKMYQKQQAFGWVQLALIVFDTIVLVYNQIVRLHMLRRLMKDIKEILNTGQDQTNTSWNMAGAILPRCYYTVISNFIVVLVMACLFGIQSNRDNYTSSDYRLTKSSAFVMILLLLLPSLSLVLFFAVNLYWILEILMKINFVVGSSDEFQEKIRNNYGTSLAGALQYSRQKIPSSEKKLETVEKTKTISKLLYCLHEIHFLFLIFIWQWLIICTVYLFDGFEDTTLNLGIKVGFVAMLIIANPHVALLMVLSNFMVLFLLLGLIIYPLCLPLCCKKQYKVQSKYSQLMAQGETSA